jgi:hypothetical protein
MSSVRAHSPIPEKYANMPVEDVERELGRTIKLAPLSVTDRVKSYWGFSPNHRPDPVDLLNARRAAYLKHKQGIYNKPSVGQIPVGEIYDEPYAAQAKQPRPKGYPPFPITPEDIIDAKKQVQHILMRQPDYEDYGVYSNALTAARDRLERLQRQFDEQERKHPGAYKYPPYNTENLYAFSAPPLTQSQMSLYPSYSGGKSKRVKRTKTCKSKRVKRSKTRKNRVHKRRN